MIKLYLISFLIALSTSLCHADGYVSAESLLDILKAKDSQFDNAVIFYKNKESITVNNSGWKVPYAHNKHIVSNPGKIEVLYNEAIIVRKNDTTFIREIDQSSFPDEEELKKPGIAFPAAYQKWSNIGGKQLEYSHSYPDGYQKADRPICMIYPDALPGDGIVLEQRMEVEFAHGFGFGKRIKQISSIERVDGGYAVKGSIQIWSSDESSFSLKVDDDFIVREAVIESRVGKKQKKAYHIIEIATEGTEKKEGRMYAQNGSYTRTKWVEQDGKRLGKGLVDSTRNIEFKDVKYNLSDDDYEKLVDIDIPDGTSVFDRIAGIHYVKGKDMSSIESVQDDGLDFDIQTIKAKGTDKDGDYEAEKFIVEVPDEKAMSQAVPKVDDKANLQNKGISTKLLFSIVLLAGTILLFFIVTLKAKKKT